MRRRSSTLAVASLAALLVACGGADDPPPPVLDGDTWVYAAAARRDLDLLFVVDNSGTMAGEQNALAAAFPMMLDVLAAGPDGLPNLHVGVVSSNVGAAGEASVPGCAGQGDDGNLLVRAACNPLRGNFIVDVADGSGGRDRNYTGDLGGQFGCMAQLGTGGCGFEQHLESMFRALQPGKNPGFYRPDAALGIVIIADEDDCSTELGAMFGDPTAGLTSPLGPRTSFRCFEFGVSCEVGNDNPRAFGTRTGCAPKPASPYMHEVDRYVDFLASLKADPSLVSVAGIVGTVDEAGTVEVGAAIENPTSPAVRNSCFTIDPNDPNDGAAPAIRTTAFLRAFGDRHVEASICNGGLGDALEAIGEGLARPLGNTCVRGRLEDQAPATACDRSTAAGCEFACEVKDVNVSLGRTETVVPACADRPRARPCWRVAADAAQCAGAPDPLAFVVDRASTPAPGTFVEIRCAVE